jgi:hypothetical protein
MVGLQPQVAPVVIHIMPLSWLHFFKIYQLTHHRQSAMPANITHAVKAVEKFKMVLTMIKSS